MVLTSDTAAWCTQTHCQLPWGPIWAHPLSSRRWLPRPPELPTLGLEREGLAQQGPQAGQVSSSWGLQGQGEGTLHRDGQQGLGVPHSHSLRPGEGSLKPQACVPRAWLWWAGALGVRAGLRGWEGPWLRDHKASSAGLPGPFRAMGPGLGGPHISGE